MENLWIYSIKFDIHYYTTKANISILGFLNQFHLQTYNKKNLSSCEKLFLHVF